MKAKLARQLIRAAFEEPDPPEQDITEWADRFATVGLPVGMKFDADVVLVMLAIDGQPKMGLSCGRSVTFGREIQDILHAYTHGDRSQIQLDLWSWQCTPSLRKGENHAIPLRNLKDARWRGFRPNAKGLLTIDQIRANARLPVFPPIDLPKASR